MKMMLINKKKTMNKSLRCFAQIDKCKINLREATRIILLKLWKMTKKSNKEEKWAI